MIDSRKSKKQLIEELKELRQSVKVLDTNSAKKSRADIAVSNQAEEELRESESMYRRSIENASGVPYRLDRASNTYSFIGTGIKDLVGITPEEFTPQTYSKMILEHVIMELDGMQDVAGYCKVFWHGKVKQFKADIRIKTPSGNIKWISDSAVPIYDNTNQIVGSLGILMDITERKQVEHALSESENKYRTLFDKSADAILIIEGEQFVDCNDAAVKMLGYRNKKELLKTHPSQLSPETQPDGKSSFEKANEIMATAFEKGSHRFEWEHIKFNGEVFPVEVLLTAVAVGERKFLHTVWRDISERKRLEEAESRAARLEIAGTIAGQVAHDFNNLLAPLMAYPEFIRDRLPKDHPTLKYLNQIEKASQKIADINQQLLSLGRRGHYNLRVMNLNSIIEHAVNEMAPIVGKIAISTNLEPKLNSIFGGDAQIHRVIINLLYNAVDALQTIGHISIRTENYYADDVSGVYGRVPKGEYVKLTVTDNGSGMADEIVQNILDPFFTTKASDQNRGSGLGLSVVDAVVKDHNGFLDLETTLGKGTSFYLYFPVTDRLADDNLSDKHTGGNENILVVDDDSIQREVSTQLLKRLGYEVNTVDSGEKAIEFLQTHPHELVLLDMIMPGGIDGTETYQQILKFSPHQKAIIVSGFSETNRVQEALTLGVGAFVKKPLTKKTIALAVRKELDKKQKTLSN